MARTEQVDIGPTLRSRPQQLAWAVMLVAFTTFCLIIGTLVFSIWSYFTGATIGREAELLADVPAGVTYQPRGSTAFLTVDSGGRGLLGEGDRVRVAQASSAGYGKVASIQLFDGSSLDVRAGSELVFDSYRSTRWSNRSQQVNLDQLSGYVRYNLKPAATYDHTSFSVDVGDSVAIDLQPGGSYSIQVRPPARLLLLANGPQPRVLPDSRIEIAVRGEGLATVHSRDRTVSVAPGQLVVVESGTPQSPLPAQWELVRDRDFSRYSAEAYNNTTVIDTAPTITRSDTWIVYGQATGEVTQPQEQGRFGIVPECLSDEPRELCAKVNTAQFIRTGNQTQGFITGIYQNLGDPIAAPSGPAGRSPDQETAPQRAGVDVSEYASLQFSADLRILNQSLDKGGQAGTECPLLIRFIYKQQSPADERSEQVFCFWYKDGSGGTLTPDTAGYFEARQLQQYEWTHFAVDLRDPRYIPEGRYLQRIQIEARGHDYNTEITNVSLIGKQ